MINFIKRVFTALFSEPTRLKDLEVRFYTAAAADGSHGRIRVSHRRLGLVERDVNFVFVGLTTPPDLTPELLVHVFSEARAQGYVPHALVDCLEENRHQAQPEAHLQEPVFQKAPTDLAIKAWRLIQGGSVEHMTSSAQAVILMAAMQIDSVSQLNTDWMPSRFMPDLKSEAKVAALSDGPMSNGYRPQTIASMDASYIASVTANPATRNAAFQSRDFDDVQVPAFLRRANRDRTSAASAAERLRADLQPAH